MKYTSSLFTNQFIHWTLASVLSIFAGNAFADAAGRAGRSGAITTRTCINCHLAGAAVPTVAITGPASVAAGSTTNYSVSVTGGAGIVNAGIDIAAPGGTLAVTDATITTMLPTANPTDVVHSAPLLFNAAPSVSFPFAFTAPAMPGTVTIFAAGLTGDGANDDLLDGTGLTSLAVTITAAGGGVNQAPVAVIAGPATGAAGTAATFDGAGSTDADGTIASYAWTFSDGTTATGVTTSKVFTAAGTFTVGLTVTDNAGATGTATPLSITIAAAGTPIAPTAAPGGPYSGVLGTAIQFDGSASVDPDGTIATFSWDFGDASAPATVPTPTYTYATAGTFTVTLTVTDNTNATGTATTTATVTDPAATPPATPTAGADLYIAECESCHGVDGVGAAASNVVGESADDIAEAIIEEPTMQALSVLTPEQVQLIADFLETVVPVAPAPAAGVNLYATECESCHGPNGTGGTASNVVGESAEDIEEAIVDVPDMQAIVLTPEDIQLIADFLASSATLGVTGTPKLGTTPVTPRGVGGTTPKGTPAANTSTKTSAGGGATDALFAALLAGTALGAAILRRRRRN